MGRPYGQTDKQIWLKTVPSCNFVGRWYKWQKQQLLHSVLFPVDFVISHSYFSFQCLSFPYNFCSDTKWNNKYQGVKKSTCWLIYIVIVKWWSPVQYKWNLRWYSGWCPKWHHKWCQVSYWLWLPTTMSNLGNVSSDALSITLSDTLGDTLSDVPSDSLRDTSIDTKYLTGLTPHYNQPDCEHTVN